VPDGEQTVVDNMRHNIAQNLPSEPAQRLPAVHVHRWGDALGAEMPDKPDVIIAADVVYGDGPDEWVSLLQSIDALARANDDVLVMISHTTRYTSSERFFHRLRKRFRQLGAVDLYKYMQSSTKVMAFGKRPSPPTP
jgi:predicted nicotinamide N-methyase